MSPITNNQKLLTAPTVLAIDFETYYDRDYSLKKMDAYTYVHHPKFDCYLMSIYGYIVDDASSFVVPAQPNNNQPSTSHFFSWVGHPTDFTQWEILNHATLVAHNAAFDSLVFKRLQSMGIIPEWVGRAVPSAPPNVDATPPSRSPSAQPSNYQPSTINWRCTASLAVYLSAPRSLKGACKQLLDITVDKSQRDKSKGISSAELFENDAMTTYALEDARLCYLLWDKFNSHWPEEEQELATLTFEWGQQGIAVDFQRLEESIKTLEFQRFNAGQALPWVDDLDEDTPLSHRKLAEACREASIPCPASLAMDDPECAAWEDKFGAEYTWVDAMRLFRRTNMLLKRFKTVRNRSFPVPQASSLPCCTACISPAQPAPQLINPSSASFAPLRENNFPAPPSVSSAYSVVNPQPAPPSKFDIPCSTFCGSHRFPYGLKYFGAVPGRWSGDAGFNVQNMPRGELFGVDLRRCFIPSPGNVFIIADLCQIEPRILAWLIGDEAFLDLVRNGVDIYEAHARSTMGYADSRSLKEADPAMRSLAKARTLGLGYGCGPKKFVAVAKNLGGIDITFVDAKKTVQDFRSKNIQISNLWKRLDRDFKRSACGDYHIELPSGRELRYLSVAKNPRGYYTASTERGGRKRKLYGGLLTENLVQATARDVFASQLLNIHSYLSGGTTSSSSVVSAPPNNHQPPTPNSTRLGRVVFHVHDEVIVEDIQFLLGDAVLVFARKPQPSRRDPSFMKTFRLMNQFMVPGSYTRDDGRVEVAKFDWSEDVKVCNSAAAHRLNIATA